MAMKLLLHGSLFSLALGYTNCTMAEYKGACKNCGENPVPNSNFGCRQYGKAHHHETNSVKKCMSQSLSCGGVSERCYGRVYTCRPGFVRPDGSTDYTVTCQNGALDYGPPCGKQISCNVKDTETAKVVSGDSVLAENASVTYECKSGWTDEAGPTFSATCVRSNPRASAGVLSPKPTSRCTIATCTQQSDCAADASQTCDMVSNTCQCAAGYNGTPGANGACTSAGPCGAHNSEDACLLDFSCKWERDECTVGEPIASSEPSGEPIASGEPSGEPIASGEPIDDSANSESSSSLMSLAIVVGLVLMLICCFLLFCIFWRRSKNQDASDDPESRLHMDDSAAWGNKNSTNSGPYRSKARSGSRRNRSARGIE